ncbi:uncharacterized protein LOC128395935 [Panonychus citri]|uniref:uncharacterized protein LOC128395935 n=1 Tax=Panonychus citri TaxID=50023 RepID=UPI00230808A8|nr:uncharacterized protein LOC128395935 [Panonychus citri]
MSSLSISCDTNSLNPVECELIPCTINYTGQAKVTSYFKPTISETGPSKYSASFRGKPLDGIDLPLDSDTIGVVCEKTFGSLDTIKLKPIGTFDKIRAWNWDSKPSSNDVHVQALQWLKISSSIHDPISPQRLLEEEEKSKEN